MENEICLHIIDKKTARSLGMKNFFTGTPCKRGHISERCVLEGKCKECVRVNRKENRAKNADEINRKSRERYKNDYTRSEKIREKQREYYWNNKESSLKRSRKYRKDHLDSLRQKDREYYYNNREERLRENKIRRKNNIEHYREKDRTYHWKNRESRIQSVKDWRTRNPNYKKQYTEKNKERINAWRRDYHRRRKTSPDFISKSAARRMLRKCLKRTGAKKESKTVHCLGYSARKLKQHLESNFSSGMNWDNYGDWHIDHKYPTSRYITGGITNPMIINSLSNLIPMWAEHNLDKRDKTLEEWLKEKGEDSEEYKLYGHFLD